MLSPLAKEARVSLWGKVSFFVQFRVISHSKLVGGLFCSGMFDLWAPGLERQVKSASCPQIRGMLHNDTCQTAHKNTRMEENAFFPCEGGKSVRNVKTSNTFTKHENQSGSTFMLLKDGRFGESLWEGQREGGANSFISPNVNEVPTTNAGLLGYERDGRS